MDQEKLKQKVQEILKNFGLNENDYKDSLNDLEENFKNLMEEARVGITENKKAHETFIYTIYAMIGSAESLGLDNTFKNCKELEKKYQDSLDDNILEGLDNLIKIYEQEIKDIRQCL